MAAKFNIIKIKGLVYGFCVGDSLGSRYEFMDNKECLIQVKKDSTNLMLPILGGGPFNIKPGQLTDDSEMMLSLLKAIIESKKYDQETAAFYYIYWFDSKPVDIGKTIHQALFTRKKSHNHLDMINNSKVMNYTSLSNGSLMRIAPMAIIGLKLSNSDIKKYVFEDCDLTHPNPICKEGAYVYVLAIKYALSGYDKKMISQKIMEEVSHPRIRIFLKDAQERPEPTYTITVDNDEIYVNTDDKKYQGYIGVALQNTFYEFFNGNNYDDSILNIIKRGGDTDTNAAIAGGLLGAYYGYDSINKSWLKTISDVDGYRDNLRYSIKDIIDKISTLFH